MFANLSKNQQLDINHTTFFIIKNTINALIFKAKVDSLRINQYMIRPNGLTLHNPKLSVY